VMALICALFERLTRRIRKPLTARLACSFIGYLVGLDTLPVYDHRHISILKTRLCLCRIVCDYDKGASSMVRTLSWLLLLDCA
jgi:hypothetical protein